MYFGYFHIRLFCMCWIKGSFQQQTTTISTTTCIHDFIHRENIKCFQISNLNQTFVSPEISATVSPLNFWQYFQKIENFLSFRFSTDFIDCINIIIDKNRRFFWIIDWEITTYNWTQMLTSNENYIFLT